MCPLGFVSDDAILVKFAALVHQNGLLHSGDSGLGCFQPVSSLVQDATTFGIVSRERAENILTGLDEGFVIFSGLEDHATSVQPLLALVLEVLELLDEAGVVLVQ